MVLISYLKHKIKSKSVELGNNGFPLNVVCKVTPCQAKEGKTSLPPVATAAFVVVQYIEVPEAATSVVKPQE